VIHARICKLSKDSKSRWSKTPTQIQFVRQQTGTSCGIASLSMLTGLSIGALRKVLASRLIDFEDDCTDSSDLRAALAQIGIRLGRMVRTKDWSKVSRTGGRALAAVRFRRLKGGYERWHWVVVDGAEDPPVVWDPYRRDGRRHDLHNLPLAWYHPVQYAVKSR